MQITLSSHNQVRYKGAKDHAVWMHRDNNTSRLLGCVFKTSYGKWQASVTGPRRQHCEDFDYLRDAREFCKALWA